VQSARNLQSAAPNPIAANAPADHGISFPVAVSAEVLGNFSGGTSRRAIWESLWNVGVAINLEKAVGWKGGSMLARALYGQGTGLTNAAVHDFNTLSNIDTYDSLRLYETWLQQEFGDGKFSIRIGQLLADAEFFGSDYGDLFLNSAFGAIPLVSQNLNPPIFPIAARGLRLRAEPGDTFYAEVACFSGDVGVPETTNKHNTRFSFRGRDGALVFAEIGYRWHPPAPDASPSSASGPSLSGTYKLGGYYDSKTFPDAAGGAANRGEYSIYFIADQELWHPDRSADRALSFFTRVGFAPEERSTVSLYGDVGLHFRGWCAARPGDIVGLGFSHAQLSPDLRDDSGRGLRAHHEMICELTYQAMLTSHLSIQPDLQFIFTPGATQPASTAVVMGMRLNLAF
jgi:porin